MAPFVLVVGAAAGLGAIGVVVPVELDGYVDAVIEDFLAACINTGAVDHQV
jgi:hypothetical protein